MALVKTNWFDAETVVDAITAPEEVAGAVRYGVQISFTGSPSTVNVQLQGSIDGTNWAALVTANASSTLAGYGNSTSHAVVKYIRLQLTALSGGTSPTVTASVIAV